MLKSHSKNNSTNFYYSEDFERSYFILRLVVLLSCASFIPSLLLPHIGEEGVYTISSFEMCYKKEFLQVILYGGGYPRPPLYNWCIIALNFITKDYLIAARIVSILSTIGMAIVVAFLTSRLWKKKHLGLLASSIFLSGDILLRRGWLAYSDPIFSFFVFSSMALLWLAVDSSCYKKLFYSLLCVIAGFLAKVHTSYIFYAATGTIFIWRYPEKRRFLLSIKAWLIYIPAIIFPWFWTNYIVHSGSIASSIDNIGHLFVLDSILKYIFKIGIYPLEIIFRTLPISLVVISFIFLQRRRIKEIIDPTVITIGLIFLINFIPYWLSPYSYIRYLMPLYPFIAMAYAYIVYQGGQSLLNVSIRWLSIGVFINFIVMFFWYPYDQTVRKGDAKAIAMDIMQIVGEQPLYTNNSGSGGLRITAELNKLRKNLPPLHYIGKSYNGYVIVNKPTDLAGSLSATYKLGGITVYLMCNGQHCQQR